MYCRGVCLYLCIVEVCSSVIKDMSDLNKVHTSCSRFRDDGHNNFSDDENIRNNRCHAKSAKKNRLVSRNLFEETKLGIHQVDLAFCFELLWIRKSSTTLKSYISKRVLIQN